MDKDKTLNWFDKAIIYSHYGLIYFVPISIALVEIFSSFALVFFFIKRGIIFSRALKAKSRQSSNFSFWDKIILFLKSYKPVPSCLDWPIAFFVLVNFISVIFSQYPVLSIKGFFFKLLQGVYIYFTFLEGFKTKKQIRMFFIMFLISGTLIGINGIAQYVMGKGFIHGHVLMSDGRVLSSFKHANDYASYLLVVLTPLLSVMLFLLFPSKGRGVFFKKFKAVPYTKLMWGISALILFSIAFINFGLTYSRGAWVGFLLALLFLGFVNKKLLPYIIIVCAVFFAVYIPKMTISRNVSFISDDVNHQKEILMAQRRAEALSLENMDSQNEMIRPNNILSKIEETFQPLKRFRGSGRFLYWQEAIHIIRDYPFFGIGLNTYSQIAWKYKINWGGYPHNCFLQMAAEIGLAGFLIFFWLVVSFYIDILKKIRKFKDLFLSSILYGLLAGLVGYLTHSFFDTNLYSVQLSNYFWLILGASIATNQIASRE